MAILDIGTKNSFPPLLHLVFVLQQMTDEQLLKQTGAGLSAVRIMSALDKSVPYSQRVIAAKLGQTEANISRQLKVMKRAGLVSIVQDKKDRRQRQVSLSAKGQRVYGKAEKILKAQQKSFFSVLDKSQNQAFDEVTRRLLTNLG